MITDSDNTIIESTIDNLPISKEILIERGWKFISSSSLYIGNNVFVYYHVYEREPGVRLQLYDNGHAYLCMGNIWRQERSVKTLSELNKMLGEIIQIKY